MEFSRLDKVIRVQINDSECFNFFDLTLFQLCLEKHIYIPRFCYHKSLNIVGNCRMCLVEDKNSIKPVIACAAVTATGQVFYTYTDLVMQARESVIEFLLINHPLDCPICDQGGECDLQDQTLVFGADEGRFYELKKTTQNKNLGPVIKASLNRCIYCSRCVRYFEEFGDDDTDLSLLGRSEFTEIGTYISKFLLSEISGNVTDLCPVGALLSKPNSFQSRLWELIDLYTCDIMDSFGASLCVHVRGTEVVRILPRSNEYLNDEWIGDKSRFFFEGLSKERILSISHFSVGSFDWEQFFLLFRNFFIRAILVCIFNNLSEMNYEYQFGPYTDLETLVSFRDFFFLAGLGSNNFEYVNNYYNVFYKLNTVGLFEDRFQQINLKFKRCFMVGINLRYESPVLNMRLKQLVDESEMEVFLVGFISNINFDVIFLGNNCLAITQLISHDRNEDLYFIGQDVLLENFIVVFYNQTNFSGVQINISDVGAYELGYNIFKGINRSVDEKKKTNLFINENFYNNQFITTFDNNQFNVAFFSHYEEVFNKKSHVTVPTGLFLEKQNSYLNNHGDLQQYNNFYLLKLSNFVYPQWMLVLALNQALSGADLGWSSVENLRSILTLLSPSFILAEEGYFDLTRESKKILLNTDLKNHNNYKFLVNILIRSKINDFYTNTILGAYSDTLVQCSQVLLKINDYLFTNIINRAQEKWLRE